MQYNQFISLSTLLHGYRAGTLTVTEEAELRQWTAGSPERAALLDRLGDPEQLDQLLRDYFAQRARMAEALAAAVPELRESLAEWVPGMSTGQERPVAKPVHRIHFLRTAWFRYAAAILIISGIGAYLYTTTHTPRATTATVQPRPIANDVLPGGNKAVLTLADGRTIVLDSAVNGTLAEQAGSRVIKRQDGRLDYQTNNNQKNQEIVAYNTMRTPRGGQYQIRLPDGTKVWLNAASSITYPTKFVERERKVTIEGEAYFEVTKNARQPFIVDVKGMSLQVLGTSFNVNSYGDDRVIVKTTLLEGSVLVKSGIAIEKLQPGQQAQVSGAGGLEVKNAVNLEAVMAWKNGYFNFDQQSLETSLRQLARWYDVAVSFTGKRPTVQLGGKIQRNLTLSNLLDGLEMMGLHAELKPDKQLLIHE